MKLVVLEKVSLGNDIDISFFEEFGDVTYYDTTTSEQVAERVKDEALKKLLLESKARHKELESELDELLIECGATEKNIFLVSVNW